MKPLQKGDYVAATKYRDGDPRDGWCIGFYSHQDERGRHYVVDHDGNQFRANGYRRCERIRRAVGRGIMELGQDNVDMVQNFWGLVRKIRSETKGGA